LYAEVHPDFETANSAAIDLAKQLANYAPDAVAELNKTLWANTDHWATLLPDNAETSGRLLLLPETQDTLKKLKPNT
jgi:hypothetical protein